MNTKVIKEIANQLGIAVSAVTKDVIPAYASYAIAAHVSRVIILPPLLLLFWSWLDFSYLKARNMLIGNKKN